MQIDSHFLTVKKIIDFKNEAKILNYIHILKKV